MRKISVIFGKLTKEKSASFDSFGCESSQQKEQEYSRNKKE